jgi:hypothetical protein
VVGDRKVRWRGERHDLPRLLVEHQDSFVLKGATGWSCQEVFFGWATPASRWAELAGQALRSGNFIVQERVHNETYPLDLMTGSGEINRIQAESVVSPFCLGGDPAGCLVRLIEAGDQVSAIGGPTAVQSCLLAEA